ncbi:MAG: DEAD/DEAH box helicase [Firmicutes bacterium]|nr:DEAD/DEAH box helicase [Bacillota bacterium]
MILDSLEITVPILRSTQTLFADDNLEEEFLPPIELPHFNVEFSLTGFKKIINEIRKRNFDSWEWFVLAKKADCHSLTQNFGRLLCLEHLEERWKRFGVIPYPHQVKTVEKVIKELKGQAILADEVGLGKTIEAGMILKEYMLRGLVNRALILTPASLCWQWYQELREKFNIVSGIQRSEWDWEYSDILIASIDTAKRPPHRDIIKKIPYDMLIIDEAHKLKNSKTANWQLINQMQKKYCLMLTATPIQNDLKELFNLISLLKPGQLGSYRSFKAKFVADKRTPKNPDQLRELLSQVLIRNRRGEGTVEFTERHVQPIIVELSSEERQVYNQISSFIKSIGWKANHTNILPYVTLQREVCSSFYAAGLTLQKMCQKYGENANPKLVELLQLTSSLRTNSKCDVLEKLLRRINDKVVVFTEYKASQEYIRYRLERAGFSTLGFDGSLSRGKKEWIKHLFQKSGQILVSTESGGEGLNLQFCNHVVNYDLPWNPMRLEQRIGRVHRLGQTKDVHIYNLITRGTIEEHIMYLLHQKINMFEMVLGELESILISLKLDRSFEGLLTEIFLRNDDEKEIQKKLDELGERIIQSREEIQKSPWEQIYG